MNLGAVAGGLDVVVICALIAYVLSRFTEQKAENVSKFVPTLGNEKESANFERTLLADSWRGIGEPLRRYRTPRNADSLIPCVRARVETRRYDSVWEPIKIILPRER